MTVTRDGIGSFLLAMTILFIIVSPDRAIVTAILALTLVLDGRK